MSFAGRPAFDCRGSISISFVRSSRIITIKYEHTPLHKTVHEMLEYFKPPPQLQSTRDAELSQKTPKTANGGRKRVKAAEDANEDGETPATSAKKGRTKKTDDGETPATSSRKRKPKLNDDGTTPVKKRRKKSTDDNPPTEGTLDIPDAPDARPVGESSQTYYNSLSGGGDGFGSGSYPQGLVGDQASGPVSSKDGANPVGIVNVTSEEAARRRDVAQKLLSDSGVEPSTLSTEQFNIFANQSPDLQKESLAMLVKYGAERLRIVHPNRDATQSPASTNGPTQAPSAVPEPALATTTPKSAKDKRGKAAAAGTQAEGDSSTNNTPNSSSKAEGQGRRRGPPNPVKCEACTKRKKPVSTCRVCEEGTSR